MLVYNSSFGTLSASTKQSSQVLLHYHTLLHLVAVVGFLGTVVQEIHAILDKLVASLCPAEGWNGQNIC